MARATLKLETEKPRAAADVVSPFPTCEGTALAEAYRRSVRERSPLCLPLTPHVDDRGWSFMGLMAGVLDGGQINYSVQHPGVVKAWHRHRRQADFWCVLHGSLKVAAMSEDGSRRWLVVGGERRPAILIIPPGLWHGAAALGDRDAGLLYYVTQEYDPASPDEERQPFDWQWNPWPVEPR